MTKYSHNYLNGSEYSELNIGSKSPKFPIEQDSEGL